jgi:aspartate kinase
MTGSGLVVVKLGGDALAGPERIAAAARRLADLAKLHQVVAVTSARRGVTDHLLGLVAGVHAELGGSELRHPEADRAVATGELVTAALLALGLESLGLEAVSLDARQAGIRAGTGPGGARIRSIAPRRLRTLLAQGVVPVVTGFQGWREGRVRTLARGGTDISAVALAVALRAERAIFLKDSEGLRSADPKLVPDSEPLRCVSHAFLVALTSAGAPVLHADAARLAGSRKLTVEFHPLGGPGPVTVVTGDASPEGLRAVTTRVLGQTDAQITAVTAPTHIAESLRQVLVSAGVEVRQIVATKYGPSFTVPVHQSGLATRTLHNAFVLDRVSGRTRLAS